MASAGTNKTRKNVTKQNKPAETMRTGKSGSPYYDDVCAVLRELTGVEWGFVKRRRRVQYVTSRELPLRIGTRRGRPYESLQTPVDILIDCNRPTHFTTRTAWREALATELKMKILELNLPPCAALTRVRKWRYPVEVQYALEQWAESPDITGEVVDRWADTGAFG